MEQHFHCLKTPPQSIPSDIPTIVVLASLPLPIKYGTSSVNKEAITFGGLSAETHGSVASVLQMLNTQLENVVEV
jgi:hypothetical protein